MLTTTLYLDFGEGFAGGSLTMTANQLKTTITGPDLTLGGTSEIGGGDSLVFQSLQSLVAARQVNFNGTGAAGDVNDFTALRDSIISIVQRIYEPFDVDVKEGFASTLADVNAAFHSNDGDPTGQHDAYVFIAGIFDSTIGFAVGTTDGVYGIASDIDLTSGPGGLPGNNNTDESVVVCADLMQRDSANPDFNFPLDVGIGDVAAHEAGHTFGLQHTVGQAGFAFPNNLLEDESDMIAGGGDLNNLQNIEMITRFPLMADYTATADPNFDPTMTVNSFDKLVNDPDIGPNLNVDYITGTGAFDIIDVNPTSATTADVTVTPYADAGFSNPITNVSPFTYTVDLSRPDGLVIDLGRSNDEIRFDAPLSVPGGIRLRGGAGTGQVQFLGTGAENATFTPDSALENSPDLATTALGGKLVFSGGNYSLSSASTTVTITEFDANSSLILGDVNTPGSGFNTFDWISPGTGHVSLTVSGATIDGQLQGPKGLVSTVNAQFFNTQNVVVDATPINPGVFDTGDIFTIGTPTSPGLKNLTLLGGVGNDTLNVVTGNFGMPVAGGAFIFDGGGNNAADVVSTNANANFTLSDTALSTSATSVITLQNLSPRKIANISGGTGDNTLTIKSWTSTNVNTVNGLGGNDTIVFGDSGNIDTVAGHFTVIGGTGTDTLALDDSANNAVIGVSRNLTTSTGSATATVSSAIGLSVGQFVLSPNVPNDTTILMIVGTTITLSHTATGAGTLPTIFGKLVNMSTTKGSVTATVGSTAGLAVGQFVASPNVPVGTTIVAIVGNQITLSAAALTTSTSFENYTVGVNSVSDSGGGFGGVGYDATLENLVITGSLGNNKFNVTPSTSATIHVDGNEPPVNTPLPDGDSFSLNYNGAASSRKFTPQGAGAGGFSFVGAQKPIFFTNIEQVGSQYAAGSDIGKGSKPLVKVYNSLTDQVEYSFYAYTATAAQKAFAGGVRVSMADVNGDGVLDVIVAPGPGKVSGLLGDDVKVFDGAMLKNASLLSPTHLVSDAAAQAATIADFTPKNGYVGGYYVTAGNVDGLVGNDIVVSNSSGAPLVRIYDNTGGAGTTAAFTATAPQSFSPYLPKEKVTTGAVVAVGDVDGDGITDIITAPGTGSVVTVKMFNGRTLELEHQFQGFESTFKNSVSLAVGDINSDGVAEIVLGAGAGGGSRVRVFNDLGTMESQFLAYTTGNTKAPLRIALRTDFPGATARLYIAQSNDGRSREIHVFDALSGTLVDSFLETAPEFNPGLYLG